MSDTSTDTSTASSESRTRRISVKSWPNISLETWQQWGFRPTEVFRTPRSNFLMQPVKATLSELESLNPALILEGKWYRLDVEKEKRIRKMIWPAYLFMFLLGIGMAAAVMSGTGIVAAVMFIGLYLVVEGFESYTLKLVGGPTLIRRVNIPWDSITQVALLPRPGILLVGWNDEGSALAVTIQFVPETAEKIMGRLEKALGKTIEVRTVEGGSLQRPPDRIK